MLTVYLKTVTNTTCKVRIKANSVEGKAVLIESDRNWGMRMFWGQFFFDFYSFLSQLSALWNAVIFSKCQLSLRMPVSNFSPWTKNDNILRTLEKKRFGFNWKATWSSPLPMVNWKLKILVLSRGSQRKSVGRRTSNDNKLNQHNTESGIRTQDILVKGCCSHQCAFFSLLPLPHF